MSLLSRAWDKVTNPKEILDDWIGLDGRSTSKLMDDWLGMDPPTVTYDVTPGAQQLLDVMEQNKKAAESQSALPLLTRSDYQVTVKVPEEQESTFSPWWLVAAGGLILWVTYGRKK